MSNLMYQPTSIWVNGHLEAGALSLKPPPKAASDLLTIVSWEKVRNAHDCSLLNIQHLLISQPSFI